MEDEKGVVAPFRRGFADQTPVPPGDPGAYLAYSPGGFVDTLRKLWRRKWLILSVTVGVVAITAAVMHQVTPRYDAEAQLRIDVPEVRMTSVESVLSIQSADSAAIESEVYLLLSREMANQVVERLALDRLPEFNATLRQPTLMDRLNPQRLLELVLSDRKAPSAATAPASAAAPDNSASGRDPEREGVINAVLASLEVEQMGRSHIVAIRAQSEDSALAARIANTFGRAYVEQKLAQRNQAAKQGDVRRDVRPVDARLISYAAAARSPSFPPVGMFLGLALLGGVAAGVLIALLLEFLDNTFRTDDDVELRTALPVLSVIPKIKRHQLTGDHLMKRPTSEYSEAVRKLEMSLLHDEPEERAEIVLMASAVPDEGKSGICLSLARLSASAGAKVVVVDCDWRRPQLHSILKQHNRAGVGDLLAGRVGPEDVVYRDASGAHMIFAGRLRTRDARLLYSDRMRHLLQSLARHYDLVLIDTPPVLVGAEVLYLSQLVDKAVFVVRWGRTRRDVALKGLRHLAGMHAPVAGIVLSQVNTKRYRRYVERGSYYSKRGSVTGGAA